MKQDDLNQIVRWGETVNMNKEARMTRKFLATATEVLLKCFENNL